MDSAQATDLRLHNQANAGCERWLMVALDSILCEVNPYAFLYKSMRQVFEEEQQNRVPADRDIRGQLLIPTRGKDFINIELHKSMCDPMTYPPLFPNGDSGWHPNIPYRTNDERRKTRSG